MEWVAVTAKSRAHKALRWEPGPKGAPRIEIEGVDACRDQNDVLVLRVRTRRGIVMARSGDWLVQDEAGGLTVVSNQDFEALFDQIQE